VDQRGLTGREWRIPGTMTSRARVGTGIEDAAIIAVIRMTDAQRLRATVDALVEGGIRVLEVTMTVPGAVALIGDLSGALPPSLLLGAGTVLDAETATRVIDAGARFVVSPVFKPALIEHCHRRDIVVMPGCFSPTEIFTAWEAGADFVKVFPATALGPTFFKDVKAPLPMVKLIPTGGVTLDNAGDWISAGASAVGVGTALLDAKAIARGDYAVVRAHAERIVASVTSALRLRQGSGGSGGQP
jgi:2-dehydro-3-deoxyphosphogluconate aldolase/(4S)-4-hydroxy-2-oxoglutarate aldolase